MDELVRSEGPARGVTEALARTYLTRHIVFELGNRDHAGLDLYLKYAARFEPAAVSGASI
jgi:hypothetical protein